jgi:hypothetical protein
MQENLCRLGRREGTTVPSPTSRTHARALSNAIVRMHFRSPGLDRRCLILYKVWTSLVHVSFTSFPRVRPLARLCHQARFSHPWSHSFLPTLPEPFTSMSSIRSSCFYAFIHRLGYVEMLVSAYQVRTFRARFWISSSHNFRCPVPLQLRTYTYSLVLTSACLTVSRSLLLIPNPEHTYVDTGMFALNVGCE